MENRISAELTAEAAAEIAGALDTLERHMPFLLALTVEESRRLPRMGDRNTPFVEGTVEIARLATDHLPRSIELDEVDRDLALYRRFSPIAKRLLSLNERVQDTLGVLSSDLYLASLEIYRYLKAANRTDGLDGLLDRLGQRFATQGRRKRPDADTK